MARLVAVLFPSRVVASSAPLVNLVRPITHLLPNPPSFEAHQFLFSGTSAPTASNDATLCYDSSVGRSYPCYQWFAAELQNDQGVFGCPGTADNIVEVSPAGPSNEFLGIYNGGYPCYNHDTLADLLDNAKLTWKYYPQGPNPGTSLWTAPNAIRKICMPLISSGLECNGSEWNSNVAPQIPPTPPVAGKMAPILSDIQNCKLANVSWVVPDGTWSDHPGEGPLSYLGPSWVADIVNAVGNNGHCPSNEVYWDDTVILITWDDWGGWYDHILPWNCLPATGCTGYPDTNGSQYVYGFRVPLLVVSAYNYRPQGSTGYISGACVAPGNCPNEKPPYIHDFGSILNFIEYAFGLGEIDPYRYHYADYWAPDGPNACSTCTFGLSDFFVDFTKHPTPSPFTAIALPSPYYNATYFEDFGLHQGDPAPSDPDDDDSW